jgi:hypothetical protein
MLWCSLGCEDERGDYGADGVVQEVHALFVWSLCRRHRCWFAMQWKRKGKGVMRVWVDVEMRDRFELAFQLSQLERSVKRNRGKGEGEAKGEVEKAVYEHTKETMEEGKTFPTCLRWRSCSPYSTLRRRS